MAWRTARISSLVLILAAAGLLVLRADIIDDIDAISAQARSAYPWSPDRVSALLSLLTDESRPVADRDRAVWALGQLRDSRALPVLWSYVRDADCRHGEELCRRELAKAVALCEDPGPDLLRIASR